MSSPSSHYTLQYQKAGLKPPVFVAGSFTEPQWQPVEMEYVTTDNGEYQFQYRLQVKTGQDYQFKFRVGQEDVWLLDENRPTVTDGTGNKNNLLSAQEIGQPSTPAGRTGSSARASHLLPLLDTTDRSSTPIEKVANTAAEVADTAAIIDRDETSEMDNSSQVKSQGSGSKEENLTTPLFAHECFGAYEFADDRLDHHAVDESDAGHSRSSSAAYTFDEPDLNDPTIEKFPSDRTSVMKELRKIQSSLGEDQAVAEDSPYSPRAFARRGSTDSTEDGAVSAGSLSPGTGTPSRKRDSRPSHTSVGRNRSAVSLTAIAEEPKSNKKGLLSVPNDEQD